MRVLFDQATPLPIRPFLKRHVVVTAAQQKWDRLRNGELLTAAEAAGFDVLLTTDKNMKHQQNLAARKIAIVVLGTSNGRNYSRMCNSLLPPWMLRNPAVTPKSKFQSDAGAAA